MSTGEQTVLVTGGAGFVGANLADRLATGGRRVRIYDSLNRPGVEANLDWLVQRHGDMIEPVIADIREADRMVAASRGIDAAFHFAAQVAVTTSMADPRADMDINIGGTFHLLEGVRANAPHAPVIFASTNKVYGDLSDVPMRPSPHGYHPDVPQMPFTGVAEDRPLDFHTPYGVSKGAADQYVLDYARSYGLRTAVLRMSCIYGQLQKGTEDQGWVAHFLIRAMQNQPITLFGDGYQVRDICDVRDTCDAYLAALDTIDAISGRAFNWGGGADNAVSLLTVIDEIGRILGRQPDVRFDDWRQGDQRWYVSDTTRIDEALQLRPRHGWRQGLRDLAAWLGTQQVPAGQTPPLQVAAL